MVNVFRILKPIVKVAMKLAGITPHKVEIEPGTIMNFWVPTQVLINSSRRRRKPKPPVVFLHGFFSDGIFTWLFQVLALAGKYDVYVPDLLFFGDSVTDRPDRTTSFQAECVARGLMKLGVESCAAVVGLSYGGMVAYKLAKMHPGLVESLVVTEAVVELTESLSKTTLEKLGFASFSAILMPETVEGLKELLSIGSKANLHSVFPRFVYKDFLQEMFEYRKERAELLQALVVEFSPTTYPQRIYLLWGENDRFFDLEIANDTKAQLGDKASLQWIHNAGHIAQLDRPGYYNQCLKRFLEVSHRVDY